MARSSALINTTAWRPALSVFGSFTVQETIRREIGEMFGETSLTEQYVDPLMDAQNMLTGLTELDRRRKPDEATTVQIYSEGAVNLLPSNR